MRYALILFLGYFPFQSFAQTIITQDPKEQAVYKYLESLSKEDYRALFKKEHQRIPADYQKVDRSKTIVPEDKSPSIKKSIQTFNSDARFPGEFEELQGVFISWPYTSGVIDVLLSSEYANIHGKLAEGIQKGNATVYINIYPAADSNKVKTFMSNKGYQLTNYVFLVEQLDDVWARDFGPVDYYYGANDSIGWIDMKYYPGRDKDNLLPQKWGKKLGYPVQTTKTNFEGGNILMDGNGRMVTTSMVLASNLNEYGWSNSQTKDSINHFFNLNQLDVLPLLPHDGGTGHIDLYLDMLDENTYVIAKFPEQMKNIPQFEDYAIASKNLDTLMTRTNYDNKPFKFRYMTLPPKDNGSWYTSGTEYNNYTRTYMNHLIVNKTIIQPIFHNEVDGYKQADDEAITLIKKIYPGYEIYPIDMRPYDGSGGSIHCITKELHVENPMKIKPKLYADTIDWMGFFPFETEIHNNSGIANATLMYRKKGETLYKSAKLTNTTADNFVTNLNFSSGETVEYYIIATSNNGKTQTKPITADQGGFYSFKINGSLGIETIKPSHFGKIYPNPAADIASINFTTVESTPIDIELINAQGQILKTLHYEDVQGAQTLHLNIATLDAGIYTCRISVDGQLAYTQKLIKGN
ncbi:MAG: agmatine deiminase family protein [Chitinophagales bacterium]|nr:agmatine deiminase family protein [Chitinophagales bacterium]